MSEQQQLPPHSEDAEVAALGSMLIDPDAALLVRDWLAPGDFYIKNNRQTCQAIYSLFDRGEPIDYLTVVTEARRLGHDLDYAYIIGLTTAVPTSINVQQYSRRVTELSTRRQMIYAAQQVLKLAYEDNTDIDGQMDRAESHVLAIRRKQSNDVGRPEVYVREYIDEIIKRSEMESPLAGPTTTIPELDMLIGGFEPAQLHIIAGRPKMGKSGLLMQVARVNAAMGKRVLFFSLEMSKGQLTNRNIASLTGLPSQRLRVGKIYDDGEWELFNTAAGQLSQIPLYIDDTRAISPARVSAKARRIYAEFGLDMICLDYIGLMAAPRNYGNRNAELTEISAALVKLAGDLNVPVVAASQLSRAVEQRGDKRPMLSDLRDSGSLEQDAYTVTFIYRDEYYNPDTTITPGVAELIVAANRGGEAGTISTPWDGKRTAFGKVKASPVNL